LVYYKEICHDAGHMNLSRCTVTWICHDARSHKFVTMHGHMNLSRCMVTWIFHDARSHEFVTMHGHMNLSRCTVIWTWKKRRICKYLRSVTQWCLSVLFAPRYAGDAVLGLKYRLPCAK